LRIDGIEKEEYLEIKCELIQKMIEEVENYHNKRTFQAT